MKEKKVHSYRDLMVWKKGIDLAKQLYSLTRGFPQDERFGLTAQIRRAAVSVPSNIAEGQARRTTKEFIQYLYVAKGSLAELDTQLTLSHLLGYLEEEAYNNWLEQIDVLQRMLFNLVAKLGGLR
jgi:four helix bundle protein